MSGAMRAVVAEGGQASYGEWPRPRLCAPREVRIHVAVAGICRTDLYVASGAIPHREPVILGHEIAGVVAELGTDAQRLKLGDRVTVDPRAAGSRFLGIHEHGGFADELVISESCVHVAPASARPELVAMVEPVAACTAVLEAGLQRSALGLVIGSGRIATLTRRVLEHAGYELAPVLEETSAGAVDFAVVTSAAGGGLAQALRACKREGTVVLKSREPEPASFDIGLAVRKRISLRAVDYGSFEDAVELATGGRLELEDLIGRSYQLAQFKEAFHDASIDESEKRFFRVSDVWAG